MGEGNFHITQILIYFWLLFVFKSEKVWLWFLAADIFGIIKFFTKNMYVCTFLYIDCRTERSKRSNLVVVVILFWFQKHKITETNLCSFCWTSIFDYFDLFYVWFDDVSLACKNISLKKVIRLNYFYDGGSSKKGKKSSIFTQQGKYNASVSIAWNKASWMGLQVHC